MTVLVTGGAGFIGSNFIIEWFGSQDEGIINVDKLAYAGNLENLQAVTSPDYRFVHADIADQSRIYQLLSDNRVRAVINFAAESHVDRSITGPRTFVETNIVGTFNLLEACRAYHESLAREEQSRFRFIHVSTDEVYGTLLTDDAPFKETHQYAPNSPYSASKAASDHLVRAYHHTYGLPVLTTNCSNNYGPYQFPEKLIPLIIVRALEGGTIPVYGDGQQVRDWLYVSDHCTALRQVLEKGQPGDTYNIGGWNEKTNIEVVRTVCAILDQLRPKQVGVYADQITFVRDRPGHDRRYAIDAGKIERELGWLPAETFETGIFKTVQWYLSNPEWLHHVISGEYRNCLPE